MAKQKPIDSWLQLGGIAIGILLFLFAKTPLSVALCALAIFVILIHPVWNFWWISNYRPRQILFLFLLAVGCCLIGYKAWPTFSNKSPTPMELHGLLIPANEFTPPNPCFSAPGNFLAIYLGNAIAFTRQQQVSIKAQGQDILSISKVEGGIDFSARVISADNQVVAQINNNELFINPSNYFRSARPNWHSLIITDPQGEEVLNVYYLNPWTVRVLGRFYSPGHPPIIVTKEALMLGTDAIFTGTTCFGSSGGAAIAIN